VSVGKFRVREKINNKNKEKASLLCLLTVSLLQLYHGGPSFATISGCSFSRNTVTQFGGIYLICPALCSYCLWEEWSLSVCDFFLTL